MRKSQRQHAFSWLGLILSTIVLAVFGFISVMATLSYNDCKELQTVIDKGIIVEGEIVALEYSSGVKYGSGSIYYIKYQYVDEDGIIYESYCGRGDHRTVDEARKLIGEKVEIYIGLSGSGQPLTRPVSYGTEVDVTNAIIVMSGCYSAIVLYIIAIILYCLFFYNKLPFQKKKSDKKENFS